MTSILLMFAVNNPDNGLHTGKADAFDFEDLLRLEGLSITCYRIGNISLKISRRVFPILSYGSWIGNWCWDGAQVTLQTAQDIAEYLRSLNKFDCIQAEVSIFEAWESGAPIEFDSDLEEQGR